MDSVIGTDVDGSLAFGTESHGVRATQNGDIYTVTDPSSSTTHQCYDISTGIYHVYFALNTRNLLRTLAGRHDIVLATGARPSTAHSRREAFDFVAAVILENGGMILDGDYEIDQDWEAHLEPDRRYLGDVKAQLESQGWVLDDEGRTSALRVRPKDNSSKGSEEFEALCRDLELPGELKTTVNFDCLDIILEKAGKGNAARYLIDKNGYTETTGIGDDINDIGFLSETNRSFVLRNAQQELLDLAEREGWHVSKKPYFEGINEILQHILMS